jgi:hypothetical protein
LYEKFNSGLHHENKTCTREKWGQLEYTHKILSIDMLDKNDGHVFTNLVKNFFLLSFGLFNVVCSKKMLVLMNIEVEKKNFPKVAPLCLKLSSMIKASM